MKALRLDGTLAPFLFCYWMSEICIVSRNWDFIFFGHVLMLAALQQVSRPCFMPQGKSGKEFLEWSMGFMMKCGLNQMSIFRMKVYLFICLNAWEIKNPVLNLNLLLVWLPSRVYGQNMAKGFSEAKCCMLCVGRHLCAWFKVMNW